MNAAVRISLTGSETVQLSVGDPGTATLARQQLLLGLLLLVIACACWRPSASCWR